MDGAEIHWRPATATPPREVAPPLVTTLARGLRNRCPACGEGHVLDGYLHVAPACTPCGAEFAQIRADDAPPYFTIVIMGHVLVPTLLWVDRAFELALATMTAIFVPLALVLTLLIMRPVKAATVALMYRLGFGRSDD